jgi:AcrR family transcriptional regulator
MAGAKRRTKSQSHAIAKSAARRPTPAPRPRVGRAETSAARREAILAAALDEFAKQGFAATRMEDVARRAGVAKGTIYLYFADKEALFQELVRTMLGPLVANLDKLRMTDIPVRMALEGFANLFVTGLYGTRRRDVAQLVISEGARFPKLAEFYYREVVERGMSTVSALLERGIARGEVSNPALARYPQLVAAPAILAIIWAGLFDRFAKLDVAGMMRAHIELLLGRAS